MIYSVSGKLIYKSLEEAVIEAGGIGYRINIPPTTFAELPNEGENAFLFTHFAVREDAFELYGFAEKSQCDFFKTLITVSGVGPKSGISILSVMTPEAIVKALSTNNYKPFTAANGIGPKVAQRIVLELKDKVAKMALPEGVSGGVDIATPAIDDDVALEALLSLGFTRSEANKALAKVDSSLQAEQKITAALRLLSNGR